MVWVPPVKHHERKLNSMATRIRLRRVGRKKLPLYRIVVADQESPRDGRFIEILGTYNPKGATPAEKVVRGHRQGEELDRPRRHPDGHRRGDPKQAGVLQGA